MPLPKGLILDDEELGKNDDAHRPGQRRMLGSALRTWRGPRRKRLFIGIVALYLLFLCLKNLPTYVASVNQRYGTRFLDSAKPQPPSHTSSAGPPPRLAKSAVDHYYDGPVKFYNLAPTLDFGRSSAQNNRNVLFAASSLKSASNILSWACDMSRRNRNQVHLAMLGRDDMTIDMIKKVNGVNETDCAIQWHDGRPDYAPYSTHHRIDASVRASFEHIARYMRPHVVFTDDSAQEDNFFHKAVRDKARQFGIPVIELPRGAAETLQWITRLDSASIRSIDDINIEILVHAPNQASGSLIRLLKSLEDADYFGLPVPKITIELPAIVDAPTSQFLQSFRWPPGASGGGSTLTLRHRVNPVRLSTIEASINLVESYYPANPENSHVLILSSVAELSSTYYHYLLYTLLEYKYSASSATQSDQLLGISLDLPHTHLNGSTPFAPPKEDESDAFSPLFLWQAPNSNAALYFGDKWKEFHSFVSSRISGEADSAKSLSDLKLVSHQYPAWMEYMLELSKARAYFMLYPAFATSSGFAIVTVHHDLYQIPEEYRKSGMSDLDGETPDSLNVQALSTSSDEVSTSQKLESATTATSSILRLFLPEFSADVQSTETIELPSLERLYYAHMLSSDGERVTPSSSDQAAREYAEAFALKHGGCKSVHDRSMWRSGTIGNLFCRPEISRP